MTDTPVEVPPDRNLGDPGHINDHNLLSAGIETLDSKLASKLDAAAGQVVNFWSVTKSDTFSGSITAGNDSAVTGLSISGVALSSATNKLMIVAFFGVAASSGGRMQVGLAVSDGSSLLSVGDTAGGRTSTTAGGFMSATAGTDLVTNLHTSIVYTPGDISARTYSVHAVNIDSVTRTVYINRNESDLDNASVPRGASALHIMEISA